jgi:hypothetical protein
MPLVPPGHRSRTLTSAAVHVARSSSEPHYTESAATRQRHGPADSEPWRYAEHAAKPEPAPEVPLQFLFLLPALPNLMLTDHSVPGVNPRCENIRLRAGARRNFVPIHMFDASQLTGQPGSTFDPAALLNLAPGHAAPPCSLHDPVCHLSHVTERVETEPSRKNGQIDTSGKGGGFHVPPSTFHPTKKTAHSKAGSAGSTRMAIHPGTATTIRTSSSS